MALDSAKNGSPRFFSRLLGILGWTLLCFCLNATAASEATRPLRVGTFLDSPFVEKENDRLTGFTVDLWESIAGHYAIPYSWKQYDTITDLLVAIDKNEIDVAATDLSITSERHRRMEFSHPYFTSGLRIMINERRHAGLGNLLSRGGIDSGHLRVLGLGLLVLLAVTLIVMVVERRLNGEFPQNHVEGFAESLYHVVSVLLKGQTSHKSIGGALGRFLAVIWMVCGVSAVSYVTAIMASVMTTASLHQQIHGPSDLAGKPVGTVKGTTAQSYLSRMNIPCQAFPDLQHAVDALLKHYIDAIVYDAPILEYYDERHPEQPVTVVGPLFEKQDYGLAFPIGSKLRRKVDGALLQTIEDGSLERLRVRYFGATR